MDHLDQSTTTAGGAAHPARRGRRAGLFAAGAAFGITLAGLGIAGAQGSGPTTTTAPSAPAAGARVAHGPGHLEAAAEAVGIPPAELRQALAGGQSIADVARARGVEVQAVIDALVADAQEGLTERITALVNRAGPPDGGGPRAGGPGHGPRRPGHHLAVAAEAIGVPPAELAGALRDGQSIAEVARAEGVEVQTVIDALVAQARERLAEQVAAGHLTQAEADEKAADLVERVTELVNRTRGSD